MSSLPIHFTTVQEELYRDFSSRHWTKRYCSR